MYIDDNMPKKEQDPKDALPILEFMLLMEGRIKGLRHIPKTDNAIRQAQDLVREIKYRFVKEYKLSWEDFDMKFGSNLRQSAEILELYSYRESDKRKSARIEEFKSEYLLDLSRKITVLKRNKETGSPTIPDDEF